MDPATPDSAIRDQQAELNRRYDAYTAKYGLLNSRGNAQAFSDDSSYYLSLIHIFGKDEVGGSNPPSSSKKHRKLRFSVLFCCKIHF